MIKGLIIFLSVLLAVAFSTLLERKLLSYGQVRKGPAIVGPVGSFQPFADGLKLMVKRGVLWRNKLRLLITPSLTLIVIFLFWMPIRYRINYINLGCLFILTLGSLGGLRVLVVGWYGGRSYSFIGGLRAAAQIISYEVVLSFFFLLFCSIDWSIDLYSLTYQSVSLIISLGGISCLWGVTILAETNRAPFDLREGESELVRGFNTEYSRVLFTMLFIGEYGILAGYGILRSYFLLGRWVIGRVFITLLLWVRVCFPRKRYDSLILLLWLYYFPLLLISLLWWIWGLLV